MALHVSNEVVLRDMADDPAKVCRTNSLAKKKTEISIAEHLRRDFVGAIEPGVVCRIEDEPPDLLDC